MWWRPLKCATPRASVTIIRHKLPSIKGLVSAAIRASYTCFPNPMRLRVELRLNASRMSVGSGGFRTVVSATVVSAFESWQDYIVVCLFESIYTPYPS